MSTKRSADDETPLDGNLPESKRQATLQSRFMDILLEEEVSTVEVNTNFTCNNPIVWADWSAKYFATQDEREKRGCTYWYDPMLTLCETLAKNLCHSQSGNLEIQALLHSMIISELEYGDKDSSAQTIKGLEEIRSSPPYDPKEEEAFYKVMNEFINRYTFMYTPIISGLPTYFEKKLFGIHPSGYQ